MQIHVRDNLPLVHIKNKYAREKPPCEYGKKKNRHDEYFEFEMDDIVVNKSVENCNKITIGLMMDRM